MKHTTFEDTYKANQPLRLAACKKYYDTPLKRKFAAIEAARATKGKFGNWICLVKMDDGTVFYTTHYFREKWVAPGWVLGMWNELTLIEKITSK